MEDVERELLVVDSRHVHPHDADRLTRLIAHGLGRQHSRLAEDEDAPAAVRQR
jgi:hypothetical protein